MAIRNGAENLKAYLEEAVRRGWSQRDIGEAIGVSQRTVSNRMLALGVEPKQPKVQPPRELAKVANSDEAEAEDDEVVDEAILDANQAAKLIADGAGITPRRRPLVEDLTRARLELLRVTTRFTRLAEDDRFKKNLTHVSTLRSDLVRARDVMQSVIDQLPAPEPGPAGEMS
jgi:transcriptional regulator with XRE-family HTH domain